MVRLDAMVSILGVLLLALLVNYHHCWDLQLSTKQNCGNNPATVSFAPSTCYIGVSCSWWNDSNSTLHCDVFNKCLEINKSWTKFATCMIQTGYCKRVATSFTFDSEPGLSQLRFYDNSKDCTFVNDSGSEVLHITAGTSLQQNYCFWLTNPLWMPYPINLFATCKINSYQIAPSSSSNKS